MTTLITGLDGFTGQYLKNELEGHGRKVVGLKCDITDIDALNNEVKDLQPDYVVNLAAIAFVEHGDVNSFYKVNLIGARNLLAALSANAPNVRAILLASSANVYGNHPQGELKENAILSPANDYAVSKIAMEQMAKLWMDRLPIFITRPFNYTGVGQDKKLVIPKIISHFIEKKSVIELGNLDVWREFGDVRVVVDIYRKLLEICPQGETLNICTGNTYSLREVIGLCERISDHSIEVRINPDFVRENEVRVLRGDNNRLKKIISDINSINLEDTLSWMLSENNP